MKYYVFLDGLNNVRSKPKPYNDYQDVLDATLKRTNIYGRVIVAMGSAEHLKANYQIRWQNWEIKEDGST